MITKKVLVGIRSLLVPLVSDKVDRDLHINICGPVVMDKIKNLLNSDKPVMICRFGATELTAMEGYRCAINAKNIKKYLNREIEHIGYANYIAKNMWELSGFFPSNKKTLDRFSEMMIELIPLVDILGSWRFEENLFSKELKNAIKVPLADLEPYYFEKTWMPALEGKKVLVIHPFEDTIKKQHARLDKLFDNPEMAPKYELKTIKAVQSIAGNKPEGFNDWFEALDWMKREIDKTDFDIAIIGCGAYGFPLAAYVKEIGKTAIHLGGAVANLFGIRSNMVENSKKLSKFVNEYWVRASAEETPKGNEMVEGSLYW